MGSIPTASTNSNHLLYKGFLVVCEPVCGPWSASDAVPLPEREKLKRVAEVLGKRPRLKLIVHGRYEAKADGEALRSLHVRRDLARHLDLKVKPGEDPGPVGFDRPKTQRALERLAAERGVDVKAFQATYEKTNGKKVERVNPVLVMLD